MLLLETFNSQNQELRMLLELLPEKILFNKPKPEKWSIAEIVEHLNISDKGAYLALLKQGEIPTDEEKEASIQLIRSVLSGSNGAWIAPEVALPTGRYQDKSMLIADFFKLRTRLEKQFENWNPEHLAIGLGHPRLGFMTQKQWLEFLNWHTLHHFKQIQGIVEQNRGY